MRTTLTLDDDIFKIAKRQANAQGVSLGAVISKLVRRGLNTPGVEKHVLGLFKLPADSPSVTTETVRELVLLP